MSPNPLKEDTHPQEVKKGESLTNLNTQKSFKMIMPDGNIRTFITSENSSGIEQNGQFATTDTTYVVFDPAGNPMPIDPRKLTLLYSGLFRASVLTKIFLMPSQWESGWDLIIRKKKKGDGYGGL